jgi:MFS family permease
MSVGIPGTGIGGLFYLISGLLIPAREILASATKKPRRPKAWSLIVRQTLMVIGILAGIWLTGWILGFLVTEPARAAGPDGSFPAAKTRNLWGTAAVLAGVATLGAVLLAVESARFLLRRKKVEMPSPAPQAATDTSDAA